MSEEEEHSPEFDESGLFVPFCIQKGHVVASKVSIVLRKLVSRRPVTSRWLQRPLLVPTKDMTRSSIAGAF
jgi:hypothetical protein